MSAWVTMGSTMTTEDITQYQSVDAPVQVALRWAEAKRLGVMLGVRVARFGLADPSESRPSASSPRKVEAVSLVFVNPDRVESVSDGPWSDATEKWRAEMSAEFEANVARLHAPFLEAAAS
jgi:hypothetical protein